MGTWCSGITPAQHAGGPGFNPQWVHFHCVCLGYMCIFSHFKTDELSLSLLYVWVQAHSRQVASKRKPTGMGMTFVCYARMGSNPLGLDSVEMLPGYCG